MGGTVGGAPAIRRSATAGIGWRACGRGLGATSGGLPSVAIVAGY